MIRPTVGVLRMPASACPTVCPTWIWTKSYPMCLSTESSIATLGLSLAIGNIFQVGKFLLLILGHGISYSIRMYIFTDHSVVRPANISVHQRLKNFAPNANAECPFRPTKTKRSGLNGQYSANFVTSVDEHSPKILGRRQAEERQNHGI